MHFFIADKKNRKPNRSSQAAPISSLEDALMVKELLDKYIKEEFDKKEAKKDKDDAFKMPTFTLLETVGLLFALYWPLGYIIHYTFTPK